MTGKERVLRTLDHKEPDRIPVDFGGTAVTGMHAAVVIALRRCDIFSKDGGFVFNAVHNIQANVPVANVAAMFAAVREFNGAKG